MWFRKKKQSRLPKPLSADSTEPAVVTTQPFTKGVQRMDTWMRGSFERSFRPVRQTRSSFWILIGCMVLLAATQVVLAYNARVGIFMNLATLVVLLVIALFREDLRNISTSLAILPVVQMVASSFIFPNAFVRVTILYSVLLLLTLVYRYLFTLDAPREHSRLQLKGHAFGVPLMLVLGEAVGVLGFFFLRNDYPFAHVALPVVCLAMIVFAFAEEMFLRGLVQKQAEDVVKPWFSMALTSVLYACLAFTTTTLLSIGPALAMGVVLALVYRYKHNLLLSVTINAAAKLTYVGLVATFVLR